jgi:SprB repeat
MRGILIALALVGIDSCAYEHFEKLATDKCTVSNLSITLVAKNTSNCTASDGSISAAANGGVQPYSYSIKEGVFQQSNIFASLPGGNYSVVVKDSLGCTATQLVAVNNDQTNIKISASATNDTGCPTANGAIVISVTGAKKPIRYKLNLDQYQSANTFINLKAGSYSITVIDSTNCQRTATVTITRNGPSFSGTISSIISANCSTSGCHNGSRNPNLSTYTGIHNNGAAIVGAISGNMPPGKRLTQDQINLITCWVNDGAPNN